jgi:septal ring-binding cell division protein DamX
MLPPTSLITLLRLFEREFDGTRLVSIILFANEQIDLLLATPQLQVMSPQTIQTIDVPHFSRGQAHDFMYFLLKKEGLSEHFALSETKLGRIYKEIGGVPGLLAIEILKEISQGSDEIPPLFSGYRKQLIIGGIPVLLLLGLLLLYQDAINRLFELDKHVPSASFVPDDLPPTELERKKLGPSQEVERVVVEKTLTEPWFPAEPPEPDPSSTTLSSLKHVKPDLPPETDTGAQALEKKPDNNAGGDVSSLDSVEQTLAETKIEQPTLADKRKPVTPLEEEVSAEAALSDEGSTEEVEGLPKRSIAVTSRGVVSDRSNEEAMPDILRNQEKQQTQSLHVKEDLKQKDVYQNAHDWINSQPPQSYTLQLVAVENIESLHKFIKIHGLQGQVYTHKSIRNGTPWYSLLWGSFASRNQAMKAQIKLPSKVQKGGVWARTFSSLR